MRTRSVSSKCHLSRQRGVPLGDALINARKQWSSAVAVIVGQSSLRRNCNRFRQCQVNRVAHSSKDVLQRHLDIDMHYSAAARDGHNQAHRRALRLPSCPSPPPRVGGADFAEISLCHSVIVMVVRVASAHRLCGRCQKWRDWRARVWAGGAGRAVGCALHVLKHECYGSRNCSGDRKYSSCGMCLLIDRASWQRQPWHLHASGAVQQCSQTRVFRH